MNKWDKNGNRTLLRLQSWITIWLYYMPKLSLFLICTVKVEVITKEFNMPNEKDSLEKIIFSLAADIS